MTINCSLALAAAILGASFVSSPAAEPSSFVLLDQVVTHTGNQQLYQNWDFNIGHKTPANAPTNWLAACDPSCAGECGQPSRLKIEEYKAAKQNSEYQIYVHQNRERVVEGGQFAQPDYHTGR